MKKITRIKVFMEMRLLALVLVLGCSMTLAATASAAETALDEEEEEETVEFKDKQGLTYSTLQTAGTIYSPTSKIEVSVAEENRNKVAGKIVVPAAITYTKTGKKYKVTTGFASFLQCNKITSLILPSSWNEVGDLLCFENKNLKSVTLKAKSIERIGIRAFCACKKLTSVKNIGKVKAIAREAFCDCTSLKTLKLDSVDYIDAGAFRGCKKLSSITIGKKFTELYENAFSGCKKLKTITIYSTKIKKVDKKAFKGTSHKITIKVPKKNLDAYKKLFKNKGNKKLVVKAI